MLTIYNCHLQIFITSAFLYYNVTINLDKLFKFTEKNDFVGVLATGLENLINSHLIIFQNKRHLF